MKARHFPMEAVIIFAPIGSLVIDARATMIRVIANHSPTCDLCVISPTAALSSFPYAPAEAARAMRYFYTERGHRIWTDWGFTDAFSISRNWCSSNHLAIDQGPIVCMMENYRSGFLWRLFMRGTRGEDWAAAPGVP